MKRLSICLSVALSACAPDSTLPGELRLSVPSNLDGARVAAFVEVEDPRGRRFVYNADPSLGVLLVGDDVSDLTRGLYPIFDGQLVGTWSEREWADTPGLIAPVITAPAGHEPVVETEGELVLSVLGSDEHGCPADPLEVVVRPTADGALTFAMRGMPYLGLPMATYIIEDGTGTYEVDTRNWTEGHDAVATDMEALHAQTTELGEISLLAETPIPWFQLQAHSDFIEGDLDHSCEQGMMAASLMLVLRP